MSERGAPWEDRLIFLGTFNLLVSFFLLSKKDMHREAKQRAKSYKAKAFLQTFLTATSCGNFHKIDGIRSKAALTIKVCTYADCTKALKQQHFPYCLILSILGAEVMLIHVRDTKRLNTTI